MPTRWDAPTGNPIADRWCAKVFIQRRGKKRSAQRVNKFFNSVGCFSHDIIFIEQMQNVQLQNSPSVNRLICMSRELKYMAAQAAIAELYVNAATKFTGTAVEMGPVMSDWATKLKRQDVRFITEDRVDRLNRAAYHLKETLRLLAEETIAMDA